MAVPGTLVAEQVERRWDGDTRGTGVSDAREAVPGVEALIADMRRDGWVAEDPMVHLSPNVDRWLAASGAGPWRGVSYSTDGAWFVIDADWARADGGLGQLRADAYALIGSFAETATHVRQSIDGSSVLFEIVTGLPRDPFVPHGHLVRLRVHGWHRPD